MGLFGKSKKNDKKEEKPAAVSNVSVPTNNVIDQRKKLEQAYAAANKSNSPIIVAAAVEEKLVEQPKQEKKLFVGKHDTIKCGVEEKIVLDVNKNRFIKPKIQYKNTTGAVLPATKTIDLQDTVNANIVNVRPDTEAFQGAGETAGTEIWKIIKNKPVFLEKSLYGKFNSGDCYIVLETYEGSGDSDRLRKVYMWMGKNASIKRSICAYLTYELCNMLSGSASQYLEEENEESQNFLELFNNKISYQNKTEGPEDALLVHQPPKFETRLIKIVQDGSKLIARRIPCLSLRDLNKDTVYVIESEKTIFVYQGVDAAPHLVLKAIDIATMIRNEERRGEPSIDIIEQGSAAEMELNTILPSKTQASHNDAEEYQILYKIVVSGDTVEELEVAVEKVEIENNQWDKSALLDTHHTYILETKYDLYIWCGYLSLVYERRYALELVKKMCQANPLLKYHYFFEKGEPVLFQERFTGYYLFDSPATHAKRLKQQSNICRYKPSAKIQSYFDAFEEDEEERFKFIDPDDDGRGHFQVWRVVNSKKAEPVADKDLGQFYSTECYLILYEFNKSVKMVMDAEHDDEDDEVYDPRAKHSAEEDDYTTKGYESEDDPDSESYKRKLITSNPTILQADEEELAPSKTIMEQLQELEEKRRKEEEEQLKELEKDLQINPFVKPKNTKKKKIFYLTRKILYCWEGSLSEKRTAARILKKNFLGLANDPKNPAVVVAIEEGKENEHFMRIFEHIMVVHRGKYEERENNSQIKLFRIFCKTVVNSRAIEVEKKKSSLNSNDVYALIGAQDAWVWLGMHASNVKKKIALKFGEVLCAGKEITALEEGLEPEEFWEDLGEDDDEFVRTKLRYSHGIVYHCTITSNNKFRLMDIGEVGKTFLQEDLNNSHTIMMFDFATVLYVWYPRTPLDAERQLALNAAEAITKEDEEEEEGQQEEEEEEEDDEEDDEDEEADEEEEEKPKKKNEKPKVKIVEIYRGREPMSFIQSFPLWTEPKEYVDKFVVKSQQYEENYHNYMKRCLPLLNEIKEKYPEFLCEDETLNMHHLLYLVDLAKNCKQNFPLLMSQMEQIEDLKHMEDDVDSLASTIFKFVVLEFSSELKSGDK